MLLFLLFVSLLSYCSSYMMPQCKIIYAETSEENPIPPNMCMYNGYIFSNGTEIQTPFPDCNRCYCYNGAMRCCLFGVKKGPIAVPPHCEIVTIGGTCYYRVVLKANKHVDCPDK